MSTATRAWLFVRGPESVRIVVEGASVAVYGPGTRASHCTLGEAMDATLHQADLERALVFDGWSLEQLTTERRSPTRDAAARHPERRNNLRLVPPPETP